MVLGFALVDAVEPIPVVRFVFWRGWRDQIAVIIFFTERPGQILPDQINLTGADEDVMTSPLLEGLDGGQRVGAGVKRGVNHRIEATRSHRFFNVLLAAPVAIDTLYIRRKPAGRNSAIEDRNRMSALAQKFHERQTKITRSTDDQDSDMGLLCE